jgi:hypothetical protein
MTAEELSEIIIKYQRLSERYESRDEEKSIAYDRFAEFLKDYPRHSGLSNSDDEESLWEHFKEVEDEVGNDWRNVRMPG